MRLRRNITYIARCSEGKGESEASHEDAYYELMAELDSKGLDIEDYDVEYDIDEQFEDHTEAMERLNS